MYKVISNLKYKMEIFVLPLTVIEITSLETVFPPLTLFLIRNSTSRLKSAKSDSLVRSNSLEESRNCAT